MLAKGVFPTRENCDLQDPTESMLWMFSAFPGAIWMPIDYYRLVSKRFWDLGVRPVEEPVLRWMSEAASSASWGHTPGRWVPIHTREKRQQVKSRPFAELPTREQCDPTRPDEAFLWMFVALPGVRGGPMLQTVSKTQEGSKRLWDLGARPVEEPTLRYVRTSGTESNWATSAGRWVDASEVVPSDEIGVSLAKMSIPQQAELFQALCRDERGERLPKTMAGRVVPTLSVEQRGEILAYMRARRDAA